MLKETYTEQDLIVSSTKANFFVTSTFYENKEYFNFALRQNTKKVHT